MQELLPHLPAVIFSYAVQPDKTARLLSVSRNSETVLGVSQHQLLQHGFICENLIFPADRESFKRAIDVGMQFRTDWSWEGRASIRNSIRWIEIRAAVPAGSEANVYHGIVLDVDDRKRQEEERKKTDEALFTKLFNTVPLAVVMLDVKGKVLLVNRGFNEMFGYELIELRGKNLNDFIVPDNLKSEGIDLNNLIASNNMISVETVRKHKSGKRVNVILYGVPVTMDDKAIGIYGVYVDITDRKKIEEELQVRNTELDNFVYKVSHDLRAPLSSILGLVNLSKLPGNTDDLSGYIDIIGRKIQELDHFINDVLSHSKNLKMELKIGKIDFEAIISKTIADLSYLPGANEVELTTQIEGEEFYNDPWRISEILRNLISNAIKYRQRNAAKPMVSISIQSTKTEARITFADNGIGIDEKDLDRIFDMFYRATEQSSGSGIGLYIVKNAVDKLGGQISVNSRVGFGTTFNVKLPNLLSASNSNSDFEHINTNS